MVALTPADAQTSDADATVAVVTVSYASDEVLPAFLATIDDVHGRRPLIVVADNKPDASIAQITGHAHARYLPLPENRGYGSAVNAAIASLPSSVRWVLISNPDVTLGASALATLVATAEESDDIASVGPAVRTPEGDLYPSARRVPSIRLGVGHALFSGLWPTNPWSRRYRQEKDAYRRDAGWLSGSCLLVRRSAFEQIGGFDEGYFMYFEDVDLGYRFGLAGFRNVYQPAAEVTHVGGHATRETSAAMIEAHHRSARRFVASKYRGPMLAPVRWALGVGIAVRSWLVRRRLDA